jgi:hypothetical protein
MTDKLLTPIKYVFQSYPHWPLFTVPVSRQLLRPCSRKAKNCDPPPNARGRPWIFDHNGVLSHSPSLTIRGSSAPPLLVPTGPANGFQPRTEYSSTRSLLRNSKVIRFYQEASHNITLSGPLQSPCPSTTGDKQKIQRMFRLKQGEKAPTTGALEGGDHLAAHCLCLRDSRVGAWLRLDP